MPSDKTCSVDGCGRKVGSGGMCWTHYQRQRRHGSTADPRPAATAACEFEGCGSPPRTRVATLCDYHYDQAVRGRPMTPRPAPNATGRRQRPAALCTVDGCDRKVNSGGLCKMHVRRLREHGSLEKPTPVYTGVTGADHPAWRSDDVTYNGLHQRLRREFGSASASLCAMGCGEAAEDWAYVGVPSGPLSMATDLRMYVPLCRLCHKNFDHGLRGSHEQGERDTD